ncbi:hypothetical protein [Sulfuricurvum sp.]|uniref:hypothetical protein n=1 Tax=Sulfuricurvum sp. TaxID=2025608 RepID=UPI002613B50E|nr:hypothetical protein [Sulfuricurvum sp.]MDD3597399.1 hypothetical protein [Sulfuricurvum sp.]
MYFEEKLDLVLQRLEEQQILLELFIPDLRKKRHVATFLNITEQCLDNWIKDSDSPIEEGIHYRLNSRGALEFSSSAIILLKRTGGYKNRRESKKEVLKGETVAANNPVTQKLLQKMGKISSREETPKGDVL